MGWFYNPYLGVAIRTSRRRRSRKRDVCHCKNEHPKDCESGYPYDCDDA